MTDQLNQAIQLIKSGQKEQARAVLLRVLEANPANEDAWLWLTECLPNDTQRIAALERCLKFNPHSQRAQKGLAQLRQRAALPTSPAPPAQPKVPPLASWEQRLDSPTPQISSPRPASPPAGSLQSRLARQAEAPPAPPSPMPEKPFSVTPEIRQPAEPAQPAEPPETLRQATFAEQPAATPKKPAKAAKPAPKVAKPKPAPAKRPKERRRWLAGCIFVLATLLILGAAGGFLRYQFVFLRQPQAAGLAPAATATIPPTPIPATAIRLPDTYTPPPSPTAEATPTRRATPLPGPTSTPLAPATALAAVLPQGPVVLYVAADACVVKAVSAMASEALTLTIKPPEKNCLRPKFSPDGKKLAFVLDDGNYDLYVMNLDGTGLTPVADATAFAWSPDGRQLAYHTRNPETLLGGLAIVNADGSDARLIGYSDISVCTGCDGDIDLSWSPDGQWIYAPADLGFPSSRAITGNIFKIDGSEHRQLSEGEVPFSIAAAWAPNGQRLALPARDTVEENCHGISIVGVDGEQQTFDATGAHLYGEANAAPTCLWENFQWSPTGGRIVAYGRPRGSFNPGDIKYDRILVMTSDGEDISLLAHWAGHPGASLWSGDGKQIVFISSADMDSFGSPGPLVIMNYTPEAPEYITLAEMAKNFPGALFWLESPDLLEPASEAPPANMPTPTRRGRQ